METEHHKRQVATFIDIIIYRKAHDLPYEDIFADLLADVMVLYIIILRTPYHMVHEPRISDIFKIHARKFSERPTSTQLQPKYSTSAHVRYIVKLSLSPNEPKKKFATVVVVLKKIVFPLKSKFCLVLFGRQWGPIFFYNGFEEISARRSSKTILCGSRLRGPPTVVFYLNTDCRKAKNSTDSGRS